MESKIDFSLDFSLDFCFDNELFRQIVMNIYKLNNSYFLAFDEKLPNYLCDACFLLANSFNELYAKFRVLNEENEALKRTLLLISITVQKCLIQAMSILGISYVEQM